MDAESPGAQVAALPFRKRGKRIQILLITSREAKRWIIPKGWPMVGLKDFNAAKREAFEEAGIKGRITKSAVGCYDYSKRQGGGVVLPCNVVIYPLRVTSLLRTWMERHQRSRAWFEVAEAVNLVQEPGLKDIIRNFTP